MRRHTSRECRRGKRGGGGVGWRAYRRRGGVGVGHTWASDSRSARSICSCSVAIRAIQRDGAR
eukprot:7199106-Prymnesium_polylepis.1